MGGVLLMRALILRLSVEGVGYGGQEIVALVACS